MTATLSSLQRQLLTKATTVLAGMGCSYTITLPGGEVLTHGVVVPEKPDKPKRQRTYPYGAVRNHVRPYVDNLKLGDSVLIPFGDFDPGILQSNVSGHLSNKLGNGTYMTTLRYDLNAVEVLITGGL